jgi:hypothetical protein
MIMELAILMIKAMEFVNVQLGTMAKLVKRKTVQMVVLGMAFVKLQNVLVPKDTLVKIVVNAVAQPMI